MSFGVKHYILLSCGEQPKCSHILCWRVQAVDFLKFFNIPENKSGKTCIPPTIAGKFYEYFKLFILAHTMSNDLNWSLIEIIAKYGILIREWGGSFWQFTFCFVALILMQLGIVWDIFIVSLLGGPVNPLEYDSLI